MRALGPKETKFACWSSNKLVRVLQGSLDMMSSETRHTGQNSDCDTERRAGAKGTQDYGLDSDGLDVQTWKLCERERISRKGRPKIDRTHDRRFRF